MPRYEFECATCGRTFEVTRPIAAAGDPATCPDDGSAAQRLYNVGGVFLSSRGDDRRGSRTPDDADARAEAAAKADAWADAAGAPRAPGHEPA